MKSTIFFAATIVSSLALSCSTPLGVNVQAELPTSAEVDSVSYLIGMNFGSFLKGNNLAENLKEINMTEVKKGMQDFLKAEGTPSDEEFGAQFKITPDQMGRILNGFISKKQTLKAELSLEREKDFLTKNSQRENVVTSASGLQYIIIDEGAAEKVTLQDTVSVNYKGTLLDGSVFDQNDSMEFVVSHVVKGLAEGLCLLGEGGKAIFYIPAKLAYGSRGNHNIEPNSTLIFDIEILKVGKFVPQERK